MLRALLFLLGIYTRVVIHEESDKPGLKYDSHYEKLLNKDRVVVLYLGYCPHSLEALETLESKNIPFTKYERGENQGFSDYVNTKFHYHKSPTIIIDGKFFGGNDKLQETLRKNPKFLSNIMPQ